MSSATSVTNKCTSLLFQLLRSTINPVLIPLVSFHTLCHTNCTEGRLTYLMHADLFLDIFSTVFSLRGIDHFHCYRFLRLSVHQQSHSATMNTKRKDEERQESLDNANLKAVHFQISKYLLCFDASKLNVCLAGFPTLKLSKKDPQRPSCRNMLLQSLVIDLLLT